MDKQRFENLLQRYIDGNCSGEERMLVQRWYKQIENDMSSELSEEEKSLIQKRILNKIKLAIPEPEISNLPSAETSNFKRSRYLVYAGVAAAILFAILGFLNTDKILDLTYKGKPFANINKVSKKLFYKNNTHHNQLITLHDKSQIQLAPGSSVSYLSPFNQSRREIHLQGDAFFEVSKNADWPFVVYCGATITEVLGTSFWIRSHCGERSVEVSVRSGKVSVSEAIDNKTEQIPSKRIYGNTVLLLPNQRAIFFENKKKVEAILVEAPLVLDSLSAEPDRFVYNDESIATVIQDLSKAYGVDIVTSSETLKTCSFTGDLSELSFDEKFEIVCASIGTTYKKQGVQILLIGDSCK